MSRKWYYNCTDPYLYQHVVFKDLEFKKLLLAMQYVVKISPRIRTMTIEGCFSDFIRNTVVPVQFSNQPPSRPLLFSQIRSLQPTRRRQEYLNHGFELHNQFSDVLRLLLDLAQSTIDTIKIQHCDLDFEMTELFCTIARYAHSLTSFYYVNNGDKGLHSSGLLQAIVSGSPQMRHFRGLHAGMNDAVLMTMARHWPFLESLSLCSLKSKEPSELIGLINEDGRELRGASPTGTISPRAFWELLTKCKKLTTLEVHDLACITNHDLALYNSLKDHVQVKSRKVDKYHPYHKKNQPILDIPGSSLRNLLVTKYVTTPLSTPGFLEILKLFPNLTRFEYATNFYTFNNQFEGVTPGMFEAERSAVAAIMDTRPLVYHGQWHEPITTEQRLMAGMTSRSS